MLETSRSHISGLSRQVVNVFSNLRIHIAPPEHLKLVSPPPVPPEAVPSRQPTDPIDGKSRSGEAWNDEKNSLPHMAADTTFLIWQLIPPS